MASSTGDKMARSIRGKFAVVMAFLLLVLLFFHLYNFDYSFPPVETSSAPDRELSLRLSSDRSVIPIGGSCLMTVTVTNISSARIAIADLRRPLGLFALDVTKNGVSVPAIAPGDADGGPPVLVAETDSIIDLQPGTSYSRTFDLSKHFLIARPGEYAVTASYSPQAFFTKIAPEGVWIGRIESDKVDLIVSGTAPR